MTTPSGASADVAAYHLPGPLPPPRVIAEADGMRAFAPALEPHHLDAICRRLLEAQPSLRQLPVARIITAIHSAAQRLLDGGPGRDQVLPALVAFTGYSPAMAALVLDRMARDWTRPALEALLIAEFGAIDALDRFTGHAAGVRTLPVAPPLAFHVFAGNVPGVGVTSIVRSLLVRSAVLGKSAAAEPVLAPAFLRLLADADPAVAACAAVTWWPGGAEDLEAAALRHAGIVVHYGGADAIASLRARAPAGVPFIDHGPRVSFALVGPDATDEAIAEIAADVALAVATFDQQGCVSPQLMYVLGDMARARRVAARVAAALDDLATSLPRGRIGAGEAAAIRDLRSRAEFRGIAGEDVELWTGAALVWTVICDADPAFSGSCLNRTLLVKPVPSLHALHDLTRGLRHLLQTVGIAGFDDFDDRDAAARRLADMGATRICPIRDMPWPPATWHHDGRGPLTELVRSVDLEP